MTEIIDRPTGYEYIRRCGKGTYGETWLVKELPAGRPLVMKLVRKNPGDNAWRTELEGIKTYTAAILDMNTTEKANLVEILHVGENEAFFFYTMPMADNLSDKESGYFPKTLNAVINDHRLDLTEILDIASAMLDALSALRKHNIVHRDIKPDNILFFDGKPRLGDIGLMATRANRIDLIGTPCFIPPELKASGGNLPVNGGEWDLYALGKVIYIMDSGLPPDNFPDYSLNDTPDAHTPELGQLWSRICADKRADRLLDIESIRNTIRDIRKKYTRPDDVDCNPRRRFRFAVAAITILFTAASAVMLYKSCCGLDRFNDIFEAIAANNYRGVLHRIAMQDSLSETNAEGQTPLIAALSMQGINPNIVNAILENKGSTMRVKGMSPIELAIRMKQPISIIEALLLKVQHIDEIISSNGGTLLHVVVEAASPNVFKLLCRRIPLNATDRNRRTPLMLAMFTSQFDIAQALLNGNADAATQDNNGMSALHFASPGAEQLINDFYTTPHPAIPNTKDRFGQTPLLLAVRRNPGVQLIKLLIDNHESPDVPDASGVTPLMEAASLNNTDIMPLLAGNTNIQDNRGFSPLHYAILHNSINAAKWLLTHNANPNSRDSTGRTPLHWAALRNLNEIAQILINNAADTTLKDYLGMTPADCAMVASATQTATILPQSSTAQFHNITDLLSQFAPNTTPIAPDARDALVRIFSDKELEFKDPNICRKIFELLDGNPDISSRKKGQPDLVRLAVDTDNADILIQVLACRPNVNIPDQNGLTPILQTAANGNCPMAEHLCYSGADIAARDCNGNSWLNIAEQHDSYELAYFAGVCMPESLLGLPLSDKEHEILRTAEKRHPDKLPFALIAARDSIRNGQDFLRVKLLRRNASSVARALDLKLASPNIELEIGKNALCSTEVTFPILDILLSHGASANVRDADGTTPLHAAIAPQAQYFGAQKPFFFIKRLLDYGADPNALDNNGVSPADLAAKHSSLNVQRLLDFYAGKQR